jgi:hypothetical protein
VENDHRPLVRGNALLRQWRLLVRLRSRYGRSINELAREFGVTTRTIRRDLEVLQAVPMPLVRVRLGIDGPARWRIGTVPGWPEEEPSPTEDVRREAC